MPEGFQLTNVNVKGYTNKDNQSNGSFTVGGSASQTLPARNDANLATNTAIANGYDYSISQTGGSVSVVTGSGNQICVLITITGTPAAAEAVDPVFSLSSPISLSGEGQIKVGTKDDLDGITLSSITYTKSGVVTVDEDGVVTPVATGTTTINFNSSAVTDKYNASVSNSVTVTVINPITVFDASATNAEFVLSQTNIQAPENEFVSAETDTWANRTMPAPYPSTSYYNLSSTSRFITFKASGASTFQIFIQNGSGSNRKYTVKIGDADGVDVTAISNSVTSSPVFATGTTGEVTIKIIGTSDGSLYPAAIKFNPAVSKTITSAGWATYCSPYALDLEHATGLTNAYIVTGATGSVLNTTSVKGGTIPANTGILIEAPAGTVTIPVVASSETNVSDNKFQGVTTATEIAAEAGYVLMADPSLGFYKNANAFTVGANTAYLPANFASLARSAFFFGGNITAVENVEAAAEAKAKAKDGKFIENGKLVIVKNGQKFNAAGALIY